MGRHLRSRLDLYFPEVEGTVVKAQNNQKRYHDSSKQLRVFSVNDKVLVKNFRSSSPKWLSGTAVRPCNCSYIVKLQNGSTVRQHIDHVRRQEIVDPEIIIKRHFDSATTEDQQDIQVTQSPETDNIELSCSSEPVVRRSVRQKRPPNYYETPIFY